MGGKICASIVLDDADWEFGDWKWQQAHIGVAVDVKLGIIQYEKDTLQ